ncbi:diacylglycerol kinase [Paenibacillus spongiae]|uniref:Diacylglycerol kinase n=1 Tax=Paenibacillus spongiae TaxID=2909671 RepID=A0ABY5SHE3_9BACL|nr:diacylglycerol kinase [Paenibacillus spongiae]UVI32142.1 diacylglycerol kinase [Paenibacillus spongiae]
MQRFIRNAGYAVAGIVHAVKTQRHMKFHLVAAAVAVTTGAACQLSRVEWIMLILVIAMVIAAELLNTAVEAVVDLASPERHPLAKAAKDTAAAAVLVTAVAAAVVGLLLFGPRIWSVIQRW